MSALSNLNNYRYENMSNEDDDGDVWSGYVEEAEEQVLLTPNCFFIIFDDTGSISEEVVDKLNVVNITLGQCMQHLFNISPDVLGDASDLFVIDFDYEDGIGKIVITGRYVDSIKSVLESDSGVKLNRIKVVVGKHEVLDMNQTVDDITSQCEIFDSIREDVEYEVNDSVESNAVMFKTKEPIDSDILAYIKDVLLEGGGSISDFSDDHSKIVSRVLKVLGDNGDSDCHHVCSIMAALCSNTNYGIVNTRSFANGFTDKGDNIYVLSYYGYPCDAILELMASSKLTIITNAEHVIGDCF